MENKSKQISWQNPFVDIFKQFNVYHYSSEALKGKVSDYQVKIKQ